MSNSRSITPKQPFGRLIALEDIGKSKHNRRIWRCVCACGKEVEVQANYLKNGEVASCGCLRVDKKANFRHGHRAARSRAYKAWENMKKRCDNPNLPQWKDWGGRGITYDPRWAVFENFLADMGEPPEGCSLDRIDNNKGYSKENCRWATRSEQRRNSRQIHWVEHDGKTLCLRDWCKEVGANYGTIISRIHRGWTLDAAIRSYLPVEDRRVSVEPDSEQILIGGAARRNFQAWLEDPDAAGLLQTFVEESLGIFWSKEDWERAATEGRIYDPDEVDWSYYKEGTE